MIFAYAFCNVYVMPMRTEPSHRAEQCTQLLFGEKAEILEINEKGWARIFCERDGYEGWCKASQLQIIPKKDFKKPNKYFAAALNARLIYDAQETQLPIGAELFGVKYFIPAAKYKGKKIAEDNAVFNEEHIRLWSSLFLNAPYQWGGKTVAGIDCSGLTQVVFRMCGKNILRDAAQQATQGSTVDFLEHAECGDLAFFDNTEGKINHVGILLDSATIIHATEAAGRVVIDKIDMGGIISINQKKRTHNLRLIKRY